MIPNGESYSSNFSSILRVSRAAEMSVEAEDRDGSGSDPLPVYLKYARLQVGMSTTANAKVDKMREAEDPRLVVSGDDVLRRSKTGKTI